MIEYENRKKKLFLLNRMHILKEKREEMFSQAMLLRKEHERKQDWIRNILTM
jgi:hypothetical protein